MGFVVLHINTTLFSKKKKKKKIQGTTKTDGVAALENDLNIFEKKSKIPVDLDWHVYSSPNTHIRWYTELLKAWRKSKPSDPKQATKLVYDTLHSIHEYGVHFDDMEVSSLIQTSRIHYSLQTLSIRLGTWVDLKLHSSSFKFVFFFKYDYP
ncbi:hypothetical protein HanPSC8_Chr16g0711361 [Helianthus annuus]|nr:hypothetical protein HanPSC8_Chr16g0711361 [Helianthus annuus]